MKSVTTHHAGARLTRRSPRPSRTAFAFAAAGLFALPSLPTLAANIAVDGTTCTLAEAIANANNNNNGGGNGCAAGSGADTIILPASSTQTLIAALPPITSEIVMQGNGSTVVRDNSAEEFRIFGVFGSSGKLTLNQSVVTGGLLNLGSNSGGRGAGVYVGDGAMLTLVASTVTANTTNDGAGICSAGGRVYLENSTVSGNLGVLDFASGGIDTFFGGTLTINNSAISDNDSGNGIATRAAGINSFQSTVRISNSTISGNTGGRFGGAITHSYGTLTLANSTISGNSAVGDAGDGFVYSSSGGGIDSGRMGNITISNSTISGNFATTGGAIEARYGSVVTLEDSTVTGNDATSGGGISCTGDQLTLVRTLVSGNSALVEGAELTEAFGCQGQIVSSNSLFGHSGLTSAQAFDGFVPGASDLTATSDGTDPTALANILAPTLEDNGGPTRTHALVEDGPAVDAAGNECSNADQRGVARPQGIACDIGAFEAEDDATPPTLPELEFVRLSETATESTGVRKIGLRLSAAAATEVTVTIGYSDSALRGSDFTAPTRVTIPAGQTTFKFQLRVTDDRLDESTEVARLTLSEPTGATVGEDSERTLTITDNDPAPTVQFRDVSINVPENRGTQNVLLQLSAFSRQRQDHHRADRL
ncbi:MAG: choice-of-anchor Q domain-containing protein [Panacagrimonas sp.]